MDRQISLLRKKLAAEKKITQSVRRELAEVSHHIVICALGEH